jgi:hypothetical protein
MKTKTALLCALALIVLVGCSTRGANWGYLIHDTANDTYFTGCHPWSDWDHALAMPKRHAEKQRALLLELEPARTLTIERSPVPL